jgi:hypothetical protein
MSSISQSSWFIPGETIRVRTERLLPTFWKQVTSFNREHGLEALRTLLGLCQTSSAAPIINNLALDCEDAVFVAIDTEGFHQRVRELGVSILDTRILRKLKPDDDISKAISTFNYTTWKYDNSNKKRAIFRFGETQYIKDSSVGWLLGHILRTGSIDTTCKEPRNTILVGHSIGADLGKLTRKRKGKFYMRNFLKLLIIDTQTIAQKMFGGNLPRLMDLGKQMELLFDPHSAGNDANTTMRLMLMLVVANLDKSEIGVELRERMDLLEKIAREPSPRLPWHLENLKLGLEPLAPVKVQVEMPVEDWYDLWDPPTKVYLEDHLAREIKNDLWVFITG